MKYLLNQLEGLLEFGVRMAGWGILILLCYWQLSEKGIL